MKGAKRRRHDQAHVIGHRTGKHTGVAMETGNDGDKDRIRGALARREVGRFHGGCGVAVLSQ